jgi:hypothetical protein
VRSRGVVVRDPGRRGDAMYHGQSFAGCEHGLPAALKENR